MTAKDEALKAIAKYRDALTEAQQDAREKKQSWQYAETRVSELKADLRQAQEHFRRLGS